MQVRCPHCHNRIELVDDSSFADVDCPSCGSRFNLAVDPSTATFRRDGEQTIGHFELVEKLGVGNFGTVWKANDTELDRTVAIKVPRKDLLSEAEREQFLREARAAAQLRHPNIVVVHEVGRQDGSIYIASDYVQGANLQEWLTGQRLTSRETAELCLKVAEALHHAHEHGVVHRDLKPGNIMLDLRGEPHIMDFGLAKRDAGEITMTMEGQILGTPAYMSPEQARGEGHNADRKSDVYSLGVILFELLTSERPFRGNKRMLLVQILTEEPTAPRRIDSSVPRDLETICLKCLEKDPGKRYATAMELAGDLKSWLDGKPVTARPIGRTTKLWRWSRRNPVIAGLSAIAACLLTAVAVIATSAWYRESGLRKELQQSDIAKSAALREKSAALIVAEQRRRDSIAAERRERAARLNEVAAKETAEKLQRTAENARVLAERQLAETYLERGLTLCEQGDAGLGLLWMARALETVPDEQPLEYAIRANIAAWEPFVHPLKAILAGASFSPKFSPDGKHIVVVGQQFAVLWDVAGAKPIREHVFESKHFIDAAAFSPDGEMLVTTESVGEIRCWSTSTGKLISHIVPRNSSKVRVAKSYVTFHPGGKLFATAGLGNKDVQFWDAQTFEEIKPAIPHSESIDAVEFDTSGETLMTVAGEEVFLWGFPSRKLEQEITPRSGHPIRHATVVGKPGKHRVLISVDREAIVWNSQASERQSLRLDHGYGISSARFFFGGIATAGQHTTQLWRVSYAGRVSDPPRVLRFGQPLRHSDLVGLTDSNGQLLAVGSGEIGFHCRIWAPRRILPHRPKALAYAFDNISSNRLFVAGDRRSVVGLHDNGTIVRWDTISGQSLGKPIKLPGLSDIKGSSQVAINRDGSYAVARVGDRIFRIAINGDEVLGSETFEEKTVKGVTIDPKAELYATLSERAVQLWDFETGRSVGPPLNHGDEFMVETHLLNSERLLTVTTEGVGLVNPHSMSVRFWSIPDRKVVRRLEFEMRHYSSNPSRLITVSSDGDTVILRRKSGFEVNDLVSGRKTSLSGEVGLLPKTFLRGNYLAVASDSGTSWVWDIRTGTRVGRPYEHKNRMAAVTISPNTELYAFHASDGTTRVLHLQSGVPIGPFWSSPNGLGILQFGDDGRTVLGRAGIWDVPQPIKGSSERLRVWIESIQGVSLDQFGSPHVMTLNEWNAGRARLSELGGPPIDVN